MFENGIKVWMDLYNLKTEINICVSSTSNLWRSICKHQMCGFQIVSLCICCYYKIGLRNWWWLIFRWSTLGIACPWFWIMLCRTYTCRRRTFILLVSHTFVYYYLSCEELKLEALTSKIASVGNICFNHANMMKLPFHIYIHTYINIYI